MSLFNKVTKTFTWGNHQVVLETGEIARQAGGAVEGDAFEVTAEVERDLAIAAADGVAADRDVGDRRLFGEPGLDFAGRRQLGLAFVLLFAWVVVDEPFRDSFYRAMAVLVAAAVLSILAVGLELFLAHGILSWLPLEEVGMSWRVTSADLARVCLAAVPLCLFAAAAQIALAMNSKSYKEAQSVLSIFTLVPLLPGLAVLCGVAVAVTGAAWAAEPAATAASGAAGSASSAS